MAMKANITIDQGTDFQAVVDLNDAAGNAYDLTGHTVASQMRKNYAASTAAATFDCVHDGTSGEITISLSKAVTTDLEPGRYLYDIEITSSANTTTRVVEGTVTVTPGITRV